MSWTGDADRCRDTFGADNNDDEKGSRSEVYLSLSLSQFGFNDSRRCSLSRSSSSSRSGQPFSNELRDKPKEAPLKVYLLFMT